MKATKNSPRPPERAWDEKLYIVENSKAEPVVFHL
jgi:hypothetical protein